MIHDLTISFTKNHIRYTMQVPDADDEVSNLPFDLASAFAEVIICSSVNDEMVLDELQSYFDITNKEE